MLPSLPHVLSTAPEKPATPAAHSPMPPDRLCVSITGETPEVMQATSAALLPEFFFQEFRLDYLAHPGPAIPALGLFVRQHPPLTALATCRPIRSGGRLHGSPEEELDLLAEAARSGFSLVDLSLESAEDLGAPALARLRERGARVMISYHDFRRTGDLAAVLARMAPLHPDLGKIVSTAETLTDNLAVLALPQLAGHRCPFPVLALAMGEHGAPSRILGPRAGSAFTFAASADAEASAPGQITAHTLASLYRVRELTAGTRLFGVAGDPIRSSLSPRMLNTAFQHAGLDAVYLPLKTSSAEELFRVARDLRLEGFSVTMPLKQSILPLLDSLDPVAAKIGAVNTVQRTRDGRFHGFNSDAAGIVGPLADRLDLRGARVLVLGAGGAARAAVFGCTEAGAVVSIVNRARDKAEGLARESGAAVLDRAALLTRSFDVLIHATPAGMHGNPLALPLAPEELHAELVFDLVYNPLHTPLLALAQARGLATIPGVDMFVHQGARQFEIWTGQPAPRAVMQSTVLQALATRPM